MALSKYLVNFNNNLSKQLHKMNVPINGQLCDEYIDKCAFYWWKATTKQGLLSFYKWHDKMKLFTDNCKGQYELLL